MANAQQKANFAPHCNSFKECVEDGLDSLKEALDESSTEFNIKAVGALSKCMYSYITRSVEHDPKYFSDSERQTMMEIADHAMQIHLSALRLQEEAEDRKANAKGR